VTGGASWAADDVLPSQAQASEFTSLITRCSGRQVWVRDADPHLKAAIPSTKHHGLARRPVGGARPQRREWARGLRGSPHVKSMPGCPYESGTDRSAAIRANDPEQPATARLGAVTSAPSMLKPAPPDQGARLPNVPGWRHVVPVAEPAPRPQRSG
jgi:hypothetical protein